MLRILHADDVRVAGHRIDPEIRRELGARHQRGDDVAHHVGLRQLQAGGGGAVHLDVELGQIHRLRQIGLLHLRNPADAPVERLRHGAPAVHVAAMHLHLDGRQRAAVEDLPNHAAGLEEKKSSLGKRSVSFCRT